MNTKDGLRLLDEFRRNGITHDAKDKQHVNTLNFQDFVGRMTNDRLFSFYDGLDTDQRKTFIWACTCTLHYDTAIDVIRATTGRIERKRLYDEFDKYATEREMTLYKKQQTFEDCKKSIHKKIANLRSEIEVWWSQNQSLKNRLAWQQTRADQLQESNDMLYKRNKQLESKSYAFDNIKAALALLLDENV